MDSFSYQIDEPLLILLPRLLLAVALGAILGAERERADKPAGLRTHIMVSLGSAAFTTLGFSVHATPEAGGVGFDPSRIVQGVVGGLGFLGAGSIIKVHQNEERVSGLTTASSIWLAGAIGVAAGMGAIATATATAVLGFITLKLSRWL